MCWLYVDEKYKYLSANISSLKFSKTNVWARHEEGGLMAQNILLYKLQMFGATT